MVITSIRAKHTEKGIENSVKKIPERAGIF